MDVHPGLSHLALRRLFVHLAFDVTLSMAEKCFQGSEGFSASRSLAGYVRAHRDTVPQAVADDEGRAVSYD